MADTNKKAKYVKVEIKSFYFTTPHHSAEVGPGLKVSDQLVAHATRFLIVGLKNHVWSHLRA